MTTRIYLSSDAGAPALKHNVNSSMIATLQACLVDGYGAKPAAGWTKPFAGTNTAVFRSGGTGTRHYLRVSNPSQNYRARGYASMSDADTGSDPFPTPAQVGGEGISLSVSDYGSITSPWLVAANEHAFYASIFAGTSGAGQIDPAGALYTTAAFTLGFGRFHSNVGDDNNHFLFLGTAEAGKVVSMHNTSSTGGMWLAGNPAALLSKQGGRMFMGKTNQIGVNTVYPYPDPNTGGIRIQSKVPILEDYLTSRLFRGEMPGLSFPLSDVYPLKSTELDGTGSLAGKKWFVAPMGGSTIQYWLINVSDDWGN